MTRPLRVAVRSASSLFASLLSRGLALHSEVSVVDTGLITNRVTNLTPPPDVMILDFDVDRTEDVLSATAIRSHVAAPVVVLAPHVTPENSAHMRARGFPVVRRRPDLHQLTHADRVDPLYQLLRAAVRGATPPAQTHSQAPSPGRTHSVSRPSGTAAEILVVIGASTGGPPAVRQVLRDIPSDGRWAIAVVQHITPSFAAGFARWIDESTHHRATLAEHDMPITAGTVVVAPGDTHLRVRHGRYTLDFGEKRLFQRPSADNLFESAATEFGPRTVGVLLTGMGRDGGVGCCAIMGAGGFAIAQNQESSVVYGMPRAAVDLGCTSRELSLQEIGNAVTEVLQRKQRSLGPG